ncbi:MAG: tetratricopeptide repeat protein [Pseudomonadota bacterium]
MKRFFGLFVLILISSSVAAAPSGGSVAGSRAQPAQKSPEQIAAQNFKSGTKALVKAHKYEAKLKTETSEKNQKKLQKKMDKAFSAAAKKFGVAVKNDPGLFQAHSDLGYVLRRLGDYDKSLIAYNKALELNPNYGPAIEYRAEAYLGLGRLEEAKDAYMKLFGNDRPLADKLLDAMMQWSNDTSQHPSSLNENELTEFSAWVDERMAIAKQTASLISPSTDW